MASSPETAPSSDSSSSPTPPSPPKSLSDGDPSPPPPKSSPPPPSSKKDSSSSPPPPSSSSDNYPPPPPPPPPPLPHKSSGSRALSPPPPHSSSHHKSPSSDIQTVPIIVGIAAGVGILVMILIIFCITKRRKKKKHDEEMQYYNGPKGGAYYNSGQPSNWKASPPQMDHVVKVPQPSGPMGPPWLVPTPPHPMMNSTELSSDFSGGPRPPLLPPPSPNIALGFNQSTFTYEELATATNGFSKANLLGQGGFGYVHKGVLANGKEVAVKSLKSGSGQGEREFQAEVDIISRVHHRHLVSLVGYCIAGDKRMLIYEFLPNNTLEYHLHGSDRPTMDWSTRLRIALGSAKGLAYLHEDCHPRIIHRDIKASNILLDNNFEAMVADFGLARLSSDNYTHVSTRVMGTFGYLAPEYASTGKLTEKSDVFSFGIMLLELITGRRPVDSTHSYTEDCLVDWARPVLTSALEDGNYGELVDRRLENNYNTAEMARMVASAAASIRHSARRRPKMSQIVRALEGAVSLDDLHDGVKPGQSAIFSSGNASEYSTTSYNSNLKNFRKVEVANQDVSSGEFGHQDASSINDSSEMTQHGRHRHIS